ncbi:MAG TPA: TadE family protein, partial [Anaerolineales bacterium]|nr:TadE family protein [Anaerolineales bacterium]
MEKMNFPKRKNSAQAMVEFAIALPVLLLLLYGILEAGRLLFLYSTVVTASRQAVRYGATTGEGNGGVPRYQDCIGIRSAADAVSYLGQFDTIALEYDLGVTNDDPPARISPTSYCPGNTPTDSSLTTAILEGNRTRLYVSVTERFTPLVRLVPFFERDITASSARTILYSVPIVVDQEIEEVIKTPTTLIIAPTDPDPTEINQTVNVVVTVTGGNPTGIVYISGADTNCQITLNNGTGNCDVVFSTAGTKVISAIYNGDADHLGSSDTEDHTVTLYNTITSILSDLPDFSVTNQN